MARFQYSNFKEDYFLGYVLGDPSDVEEYYKELLNVIRSTQQKSNSAMDDYNIRGSERAGREFDRINEDLIRLKKLQTLVEKWR